MKRLIYYPPGTYGTFVNWLCNTPGPITADDLPFAEFGNSHRYYEDNKHAALFAQKDRDLLLKSSRDFGVLRCCWPRTTGVKLINTDQDPEFYYQTCRQDLQNIIPDCDKILVLCPSDQSQVWWYQNFCEKVMLSDSMVSKTLANNAKLYNPWLMIKDPVVRARHHLDLQKQQSGLVELFSSYNKDSALDFSTWQLRTAMVYDLHSQTDNAYQCWQQLKQEFDTIKFVSIDQLRDHFQSTAIEILDFFEIKKDIVNDLPFVEAEWSVSQEHRFKDQLVNNIVDAVVNNQDLDWTGKINLFDEVYIQKLLNDRGITLLDHDTWPTTTQKFWEIIK